MTALVTAKGLTKRYGRSVVVDNLDFQIERGRIVGLIGPNGAGKSTTLKAVLGLIRHDGEMRVLGRDPRHERAAIMRVMSYIADVASLPSWIRVDQLLGFMQDTHPAFDRSKTEHFLARTEIRRRQRINQLSKGMKTQLHLALVMGVDAKLLILDEPTLGLDIIYRKSFYSQLLNEYFDEEKTILLTTHQIEEVEHILTDLMFIDKGRLLLDIAVDDIPSRFVQLRTGRENLEAARRLEPIHESGLLGESVLTYDGVDPNALRPLGEVGTPALVDLFIACVQGGQS